MEALGFEVMHVYGLTETYGHILQCAWNEEWNSYEDDKKNEIKARQGVRYPNTEDTKVMDPADFKGKKMRVPSKIAGTILKTLGATGVKVPAPGTYEALNKGVLDGTPFPYTAVGSFKLFEVTKYHTEVNITNATFGLIMNKDKYKSLDSVQKKCIDKFSGHAFSGWASNLIDRQNAKMKEVVANTPGHEIAVASPAVIAKYKKILKPIEKDWLAEMKGKGLDGAGVLKRARQIIKKIDG